MIDRKFLIAGNWKMNGMFDSISEVCKIDQHSKELNSDLALCLPNTIINKAYENISNGKLIIGAQNCHHEESGAFTGDVSAEMLKNAGAKVIIVGHSERRQNYFENNELINKKATYFAPRRTQRASAPARAAPRTPARAPWARPPS